MLASVSLAILLGPRIVHAEDGQTLPTKSDSKIDVIKQHVTEHLVKSVDAIHVSKDVLTEKTQLPSEVKEEVANTVKPVHKIINGAEKVIKNSAKHPSNSAVKVQPKGDVRQTSTIKTKKQIHTNIHQKDSIKKMKIHPNLVKHHPMPMEKSVHHHDKGDQSQERSHLTSNSILQPNERPDSSGNKTNNDSNGSNFLGFLDKHWFKKKINLKVPIYFSERFGTQWENAPPSPPPEHLSAFIVEKDQIKNDKGEVKNEPYYQNGNGDGVCISRSIGWRNGKSCSRFRH